MIVILDYGLGNLGSIRNMLRKLGQEVRIAQNPDLIPQATHLILPGVGSFDSGMRNLQTSGFIPVLADCVLRRQTPLLGICLGMQLLTESSEEGSEPGLGWIGSRTRRFSSGSLKVPHMGWNRVYPQPDAFWGAAECEEWRFYFVHSFHLEDTDRAIGYTEYGVRFPSVIRSGNILACQFHPEKSHRYGMRFFQAFLSMSGSVDSHKGLEGGPA